MPDVQLTPLVSSDDRMHVMDRTCWCEPKILPGWWGDRDVVVHRPEPECEHPSDAILWNEFNQVSQCHRCGHVTDRTPMPSGDAEHWMPEGAHIDGSEGGR